MLKVLRSDFYRLLKGKILYLTLGLFWGLAALIVVADDLTGREGFIFVTEMIPFFLFFTLPIIYATGAVDFSSGAMKNTLSFGASRTKVYLAKWVTAVFFCTVMYIGAVLVPMLVGALCNGMGEKMSAGFLSLTFKGMLFQLLLLAGAVSLGIFLTFAFKNVAILCAVYTAYFLGTQIVLNILSRYYKNPDIMNLDFITNTTFNQCTLFTAADITQRVGVAAFYILVLSGAGILIFRKSDIK